MALLFLAHRIPYPPDRGDKIRSWHILQRLARHAAVHVAAFTEEPGEAAHRAVLDKIAASVSLVPRAKPLWRAGAEAVRRGEPLSVAAFRSDAMREAVYKLLAKKDIDAIFIFSGQMAQYVPDDFPGRVVMDFVDMDSAKFEAYAEQEKSPKRFAFAREARLLQAFEEQVARRAELSLFVSPAEADLFRTRTGIEHSVQPMGNGIDLAYYDPQSVAPAPELADTGHDIVFTGQMDYPPNVEAVKSFAEHVMPRVLYDHPQARFHIVGRAPASEVRALHGVNATHVMGEVPDVRPWLRGGNVIVAPLRTARGIQNKVIEAMAMVRAVVASKPAFEGIEAEPGTHLMVANGLREEAEMVSMLLAEPVRRAALGSAARAHLIKHYQWDSRLALLDTLFGGHEAARREA